ITLDLNAAPAYHLLQFDCIDWASRVATSAGQVLPPFLNRASAGDPNAFWRSLNALGAGGTFMGGTVATNTANTAANGGSIAIPPLDYSYDGLARAGAMESSASAMAAL